MQTTPVTPDRITRSIIAVPPMARNEDLSLNSAENAKIVNHIEAGAVDILLYGGNANFYHIPLSEYADTLKMLVDISSESTLTIPSVGPAYGSMLDQGAILKQFEFPTAMVLPQKEISSSAGIATGIRRLCEMIERPVVKYVKHNHYMDVADIASLVDDGLVSFIKYAVVLENTADDPYLDAIISQVDPKLIVSGIGEQPAVVHSTKFGLAGFTSGCVCVAPKLSMRMLSALREGQVDQAEQIRQQFEPLEDLRNSINPIRVLHHALELAQIATTGPILPLLSPISDSARLNEIQVAAKNLLELNT